jgi:hypothetical protein
MILYKYTYALLACNIGGHSMSALIRVYGVPEMDQGVLGSLLQIIRVVFSETLGTSLDQVSVFFPADRCERGLGEELVCLVKGLSGETPVSRKNMAIMTWNALNAFALRYVQQCSQVMVYIEEEFVSGRPGNPM